MRDGLYYVPTFHEPYRHGRIYAEHHRSRHRALGSSRAVFCMDELDFDALSSPLLQLQGKVDKKPQTAAIILAGGTGSAGKEGGKQLVEIAGKPILTWSAEAFDAVGDVGLIVIVCPEERMHEYLSRAIDPFPFVTPVVLAPSGPFARSRRFRGSDGGRRVRVRVLHDGARPLVSRISSSTPSTWSRATSMPTAPLWRIRRWIR